MTVSQSCFAHVVEMQHDTGEHHAESDASSHPSSSRSSSYASTTPSDVVEASPVDLDRSFILPDILPVVPLGRSVERDLLRMVGVSAPATRTDLEQWAAQLTEAHLVPLLGRVERNTPRSTFPPDETGKQQWDDACAIGLYTANSPIYRVVNGYLSAPNTTLRDVWSVAPMVRRIYEAVQRLGTPYSGPAYRVLKACEEEGSAAMQEAYAHYTEQFAVGKPIDMQQFASFTKTTTTVNAFAKKHKAPVIVLACGVLDGFDIIKYSMHPDEAEVLCLPPARFKVLNPPILVDTTVVVGVETLAYASKRRRAAPLFASSRLVPAATQCEPMIARDALLHDAEIQLLGNARHWCVLQGPKGVGKTHLASRLGQRWLARGGVAGGQQHHVRWFSAGSRERLLADYRTFLLDCFGEDALSGRTLDDLQPAVRRLIASTPNMLLIFDGVEDEAVVDELLNRLFMIRGSTAPNLHVLITSSSSTICDTGTWVELQGQHRREVPVFTDEEVTSYLTQALPQRPEDVTSLQHSPLFKTHVHNHPKRLQWISALLRNSPSMTIAELEVCVQANVTRGAVDAVFTLVVDALIAHCAAKNTKGWEMLLLAVQLTDAPIPVELLRRSMELTDDEVDDAISSLTRFSLVALIFAAGYAHEWTIPCVVLHSLALEEAIKYEAHYTISGLAREHTDSSRSPSSAEVVPLAASLTNLLATSSMGRLCYPHATSVMARSYSLVADEAHRHIVLHLLCGMALHMNDMGNACIALDHAQTALRLQTANSPGPHPDIATSLNNIGCFYMAAGDHMKALQYAFEALEMRRKVLPDPHPDIASTLDNIGNFYSAAGDHSQALRYALEALEMRRKVLPDPHPDIARSLNNIGNFYSAAGDHAQALQYGLEALEMQRKVLPDPHPDTATTLSNIGNRYCAVGHHSQALQYALEALELRRRVLPDPHPDIARSLNNIGNFYSAAGDHAQALQKTFEALEMQRRVLPDPHPDIARSLASYSSILSTLGDHTTALQCGLEALEVRRLVLPDSHRDIARSLDNIGNNYSELGDHKQALRYALEALEMRRKVLPDPHRDIAISLNNIGNYYDAVGDNTNALQYALEALEMLRRVLPDRHPGIGRSLNNIAYRYSAAGDHAKALHYGLEALEKLRRVLPDSHPHIATTLHNIGNYYDAVGDHMQALQYALEALEMMRKVLPDPHPDIARTLNNIGNFYSAAGDHAKALQYALEALEMRQMVLPEGHPDIAISRNNTMNASIALQ